MKYAARTLLAALVIPAIVIAASVSGTVKGSDGSNINAATVAAYRIDASGPRPVHETLTASTLADGSFQFVQLAPGQYALCVQAPTTAWLGLCEWGNKPTTVSVTQAQPTAAVSVVLMKGDCRDRVTGQQREDRRRASEVRESFLRSRALRGDPANAHV